MVDQPPNPSPVDLSGRWRAHVDDGDLARRFVEPDFRDGDWPLVDVPGHWRHAPLFADTDGPVLYRRTIEPAPLAAGHRRFLSFDGIFYFGDVWLDGHYLGATEGYFFPHSFEITRHAGSEPNVVAVEVANPRQTDRTAKRTITGVFSHWDNLDPDWNPGGIWRPVRVRDTGPVRISWLRVLCTEATDARGQLRLDVTLDPGETPPEAPISLVTHVVDQSGARLAEVVTPVDLTRRGTTLQVPITVDQPPLWWPWRHGAQPRVHVEVRVEVDGVRSDHRRLTTAFRSVAVRDWRWSVNGEPIFVMGANHGPTRMALAEATREELARDVELAKLANLDLLRVHAHVTRPEFYDAADAAGLLLWQDFPLQWGYSRGTRKQAARQARKMVDRLGHHPSIGIWCAHNEPLAVDFQPGEPMTPRRDRARGRQHVPAVVEQGRARPLGEPRDPQGRPDPRGRRALGHLPGRRQWRHRQPLLLRLVPRADGRARAGAAPVPAARAGSCPSSARRPSRAPPSSWSPTAGPTSTGTGSSSTTPARSGCSTASCRRRCSTPSRPGSSRRSGTRPR